MNLPNFLQKLAPVGVAAIGAIAITGIATAPVQAIKGEISTLEWEDGTTNFNQEMKDVFDAEGGSFDVTFSPLDLGGAVASFIATNHFEPFFDTPGLFDIIPGDSAVGTFELVSPVNLEPVAGVDRAGMFELTNDLKFTFDNDNSGNVNANDVMATMKAGSLFLGQELDTGAVKVTLSEGDWWFYIPELGNKPAKTLKSHDSVFFFGDTIGNDGGNFTAQGEVVKAPEPTSMLGILAFGGLGLAISKRKQEKK
ncbi:MAG: PEP-CTERM sorting domain-containing protein [Okeania sp. SIO3B5]|uniref:PEP-CTERM sorting domain-containing protein n=1 Tax=Okeania sp. SIO3B5 TaxID=2607811 RepID=UPI0013FED114|nr:PEP-CTERM sorting domain-containing protein [Okeania sp. SIO3B5]NEO56037.1 PEP-CTERM sorting domain-containing protein [Okeania sp. SIO3B5]